MYHFTNSLFDEWKQIDDNHAKSSFCNELQKLDLSLPCTCGIIVTKAGGANDKRERADKTE